MVAVDRTLSARELGALPIFPLPEAVLFPGTLLPLHVFEPRYREMTRAVLSSNRCLAIARLRPGFEPDYYGRPPIFEVCGAGDVIEHRELEDGRFHILLRGLARVRVLEELEVEHAYRVVRAEVLPERALPENAVHSALRRELVELCRKLSQFLPVAQRTLWERLRASGPGAAADEAAAALIADADERQRLLEQLDPAERLAFLIERLHALLEALPGGSPPSPFGAN